jgi:hypothetical protein
MKKELLSSACIELNGSNGVSVISEICRSLCVHEPNMKWHLEAFYMFLASIYIGVATAT